MITVFNAQTNDYTKNGIAILSPIRAEVSETAGGAYEIELDHPIDGMGIWKTLLPGNIVRAPVPGGETEIAIQGDNVDIYRATQTPRAPIRSQPKDDQLITYATWIAGRQYSPGTKVTYGNKNYELIATLTETESLLNPVWLPSKWIEIERIKKGAPILDYTYPGQEVYLVSQYNQYWYKIQTAAGIEGYLSTGAAVYERTISMEEIEPRIIEEQLFRIYDVTINSAKAEVAVKGRHVSYDLAGNLIGTCKIVNQPAASAIARAKNALYFDAENTIATNISAEAGTITADYTGKNGVAALLDPDEGIVPRFNARLLRDNWDFFIYREAERPANVSIRDGKNLVGVTWKRDTQDIITRVMPVAKASDDSDLLLDDTATPWIDSPYMGEYPVISMERLEVDGKVGGDDGEGGTWTPETLREHMRDKAMERLNVDKCDRPKVTLNVEFVLLGDAEGYEQYKGLEHLRIYDTVRVVDETIGLDTEVRVMAYRYDAIAERYNGITLKSYNDFGGRSVAGYQIAAGAIGFSKLSASAIAKLKT